MNGSEENIQICNVLCNYDFFLNLRGGEENLRPEGWGHTLYGADKRGIEVKTKPEMKRPYWVRSSSIAWSLIWLGGPAIAAHCVQLWHPVTESTDYLTPVTKKV